jgi:hypothetical protein
MVTSITLQEGVDNIASSTITKEDKTNTDTLKVSMSESFNVGIGDTITYKDINGVTIFKGIVQTYKVGNGQNEVTVYDLGAELLERTVNQIFTNQSPEDIISTVITNYTSLTYVSTITSGTTISSYVAKDKRAFDVVTELAEILSANFFVDVSGNFKLELEGINFSSKAISSDFYNLTSNWEYDITQQVNSCTVVGDRLVQNKTETFSGDGSTTVFSLSEIPNTIKVTISGVEQTAYVPGNSTGDYVLDKENKTITFDTAPASGSNNITAEYEFEIPIKIRRRDGASIALYGQKDKTYNKPYIKSRDEARSYASFILSTFSNPLQRSSWSPTSSSDYEDFLLYLPNDVINVNDKLNNITGDFIIRKVERKYPGNLDITVGSPLDDFTFWAKEIQQKVKQLEEANDNSTILNEDEFIEENLSLTFKTGIIGYYRQDVGTAGFYDSGHTYDIGKTYDVTTTPTGAKPSKFPLQFTETGFILG